MKWSKDVESFAQGGWSEAGLFIAAAAALLGAGAHLQDPGGPRTWLCGELPRNRNRARAGSR